MMLLEFHAYGQKLVGEYRTPQDGMIDANQRLLWTNPKYYDGMWVDRGKNVYEWIGGNFFD